MARFTVEELGLSQFRICQDLSGKYFIQKLVEKGGFWSFTGHTRKEWVTHCEYFGRNGSKAPAYYGTPREAAEIIEDILNWEIQKMSQDEGRYGVLGDCLYVELDDTPGVLALREELDNGV